MLLCSIFGLTRVSAYVALLLAVALLSILSITKSDKITVTVVAAADSDNDAAGDML